MVLCRIICLVRPFATAIVMDARTANSDEGAVAMSEASNPNTRIVCQSSETVIGKDVDDCKSTFIMDHVAEIRAAKAEGDVSYTIERVS